MDTLPARASRLRRDLLKHYDVEKLHKLRICLRRMRGVLRNRPEKAARHLRSDLGFIADATNAARDWDTFDIYAAERLKPKQYRRLHPWIEERRSSAHQRVVRALRSEQWAHTLKHWQKYASDLPSSEIADPVVESDLDSALRLLAKRRRAALSYDDDRHWHKLRIAIKDLRYLLDGLAGEQHQAAIALCKKLQNCLGRWHDTVVHAQLSTDLAAEIDVKRNPRTARALARLREALESDGRASLANAKEILLSAQAEALFSPNP